MSLIANCLIVLPKLNVLIEVCLSSVNSIQDSVDLIHSRSGLLTLISLLISSQINSSIKSTLCNYIIAEVLHSLINKALTSVTTCTVECQREVVEQRPVTTNLLSLLHTDGQFACLVNSNIHLVSILIQCMEIDITLCHSIGYIDSNCFLSCWIYIGHFITTRVLCLSTTHNVSDGSLIIVVTYLTIELSILRSLVTGWSGDAFGRGGTVCITAIVTSTIETLHANRIDTRSKTCNLLIGVIVLAVVLSAISNSTATSESVTAPAGCAVTIVEGSVHDLTGQITRLLPSSIVLSPLRICSRQISDSLLNLSLGRSLVHQNSLVRIGSGKSLFLSIIDSLLQLILYIGHLLQSSCSSIHFSSSASRGVVKSDSSIDVNINKLGSLDGSFQIQSRSTCCNAGLVSLIIITLNKCLIRFGSHKFPVNSTFLRSNHIQTHICIITLPSKVLTFVIRYVSNQRHILDTIKITDFGYAPRIVCLRSMVNPSRTAIISEKIRFICENAIWVSTEVPDFIRALWSIFLC